MLNFKKIWKIRELRMSIFFVLAMLVIFRLAAHIPIPGVDSSALASLFETNQFFGLLNIFAGGTMDNFSVVALGVAPYITASIIFQLLAMIVPKLEEMQKEDSGRQKITQWTRYSTVPLAILQGYGLIALLQQQGAALGFSLGGYSLIMALLVMTAGTVFLMWLGELISERRIGNGISMMIFAGILAGLPSFFQRTFVTFDKAELFTLVLFAAVTIFTIIAVVVMNEGQRNIPVQYARQRGARAMGGSTSYLPLRVNMAGVIPIIFAISIVLFPTMLAQFMAAANSGWLQTVSVWINQLFANQIFYGATYFLLVFAFTYFYASVVFHPDRIADNLQKQGGFIPGIRPGVPTSDYLTWVSSRILFGGATFLSLIAVLPLIMQNATGNTTMIIGGTSILIIVSVIIDMIKQIEGQVAMREYDY